MTAVTAILFVEMFTSTLSAISDIVYLCAQCTKNRVCVMSFLVWNTVDILVDSACQITLVHLASSIRQHVTLHSFHFGEGNPGEESTRPLSSVRSVLKWEGRTVDLRGAAYFASASSTERLSAVNIKEKKTKRLFLLFLIFLQTVQPQGSIPIILFLVLVKAMVLAMYKQYVDAEDWTASVNSEQTPSSCSRTNIGTLRLLYKERRKSLKSVQAMAYAQQ
ncbi:unnamed protein product, partial [Ixodes persulcatus]